LGQVKGNCQTLLLRIQLFTAFTQAFSTCEYYENHHGYEVNRFVELYRNETELPKGWNGIKQFVKVRRWGYRNGERFDHVSYHVSSIAFNSAYDAAQAVQGHWSVENNLHWMKDVNMGEDDMSIRTPKTAAMLACFNNIAVNILRKAGHKPTKAVFSKISNKVNELYKLFNNP
jgi:hypothetical protein